MNTEIKGMHHPITREELQTLIMHSWVCPLCGTQEHLAVLNKKTGYCMEKGLWVNLDE